MNKGDFSGVAFRNAFLLEYQRSRHKSLRSVAEAAGVSHSTVQKIVNGHFDNSTTGPGIFNCVALADAMGCSVASLVGEENHANQIPIPRNTGIPNVSTLLAAHSNSAGTFVGFEPYLNFCQVFAEPASDRIRLIGSGPLCLAHSVLKTKNMSELQESFDISSPETQQRILTGHKAAWKNGFSISVVEVDQRIPVRATHTRIKYIQAIFRTSRHDSSDCLVVYCELI